MPMKRSDCANSGPSMPTASIEPGHRARRRALTVALLLSGALLCVGGGVRAHPGHGAEISQEALERAMAEIERLTAQRKNEKSWPFDAKLASARIVERAGGQEWELVFDNAQAEAARSRLYIFLSTTGEYLAANFTGN
jgi:hypothetical protein